VFQKVLILRGGEASTRVARSCRRLGIESIVIAPKDRQVSRHVEAADRRIEVDFDDTNAIPLDGLSEIFEQAAGADAVHLGYQGQAAMFELASAAEQAGLAVVGTDLDVLGALADPSTIRAAAERAHIRTVADAEELLSPRELTVLVAADSKGHIIPLADCDRSLSSGEQVLIHETPSPELIFRPDGEAFRFALLESAQSLVAALRHAGLLEVVFQVDARGRAWVSTVRVGLPRHHTFMEMVTGVDLVALQLRIASGEPLPEELGTLEPKGNALDAAVVATDQQDAVVTSYSMAPAPQGRVRATGSATLGMPLPSDDRPLIAKLSTHAPIRHVALLSMDRMLAEMRVEPFSTNIATLRRILSDHAFRAGQYDCRSVRRLAAP
jgi:acetyl/propionyl-CoA carboxylase alpha subunit